MGENQSSRTVIPNHILHYKASQTQEQSNCIELISPIGQKGNIMARENKSIVGLSFQIVFIPELKQEAAWPMLCPETSDWDAEISSTSEISRRASLASRGGRRT
jgi:hypothetical protein